MTAIEFDHVGKQYRLGLVSTGTLSHDLNRWWQTSVLGKEDPYLKIGDVNDRSAKANSEYVWALRDIDFRVEQGDVVGIIGKNGAGKSTLLKLLSKVTTPTIGTIRARGRIASLLEVGTGFHGEMTGRENIYMNGAILGMTKEEIDRKLDEIVDFSGCEKYIDTPVKRYSSGMTVRLGFAVAAFLDPEILVVDEVLAVGDAEFQKKAIGKMQDISKGEGRTVLFVSHNMASVSQLCKSGLILDKGRIIYQGTADEAVAEYIHEQAVGVQVDRQGKGNVMFSNYKLSKDSVNLGEDLLVTFNLEVMKEYFSLLDVDVSVINERGDFMFHCTSNDDNFVFEKMPIGTKKFVQCRFKNLNLTPGNYFVTLFAGTNTETYDWIRYGLRFTVKQGDGFIHRESIYPSRYSMVIQSQWVVQ